MEYKNTLFVLLLLSCACAIPPIPERNVKRVVTCASPGEQVQQSVQSTSQASDVPTLDYPSKINRSNHFLKRISSLFNWPEKKPSPSRENNKEKYMECSRKCASFENWKCAGTSWVEKLDGSGICVCSKEFGGNGNCLFESIAGVLNDTDFSICNFVNSYSTLPESLRVSLSKITFNCGTVDPVELRNVAVMYFIGVDPYNEEAMELWDPHAFIEKVNVISTAESFEPQRDVLWLPSQIMKRISQGECIRSIAKELYHLLRRYKNPVSWGGVDDLWAFSHIFRMDFVLFHNNSNTLQHISQGLDQGPVACILLYYYDMSHFQGAGVVINSAPDKIITILLEQRDIPKLIRMIEN